MKPKIAVLVFSLFLVHLSNAYCLESSLFSRFSGKTVKVFVAEVKDSTQERGLDPALVKAWMRQRENLSQFVDTQKFVIL